MTLRRDGYRALTPEEQAAFVTDPRAAPFVRAVAPGASRPSVTAGRATTEQEVSMKQDGTGRRMRERGTRELQMALNRVGFGPIRVDGIHGPATDNLVREAQARLGLTVDGIVGPATKEALRMIATATGPKSRWYEAVRIANDKYGDTIAKHAGPVGVAAALAIIAVESGGRGLVDGHSTVANGSPVIRFEVHLFERLVGERVSQMMFLHDEVKPWNGHKMRKGRSGWRGIHTGDQADEWIAFDRAMVLDREAAYLSISMGAPQILGSWYRRLGYLTPTLMLHAFHVEDEQIRALFTFLQTGSNDHTNPDGDLWQSAIDKRWLDFARQYNGPGQAGNYKTWLQTAYGAAERLLE